ncbi:hypothetical protein IGI04_023069 [Brassica rapa subsp. trilocularis]|uniref:Uncharacterized protein n=1 Tax=Brassica rapa subsp. trilocularis TaxID=1813537 RepID=A0ABQ7M2R4_BRACM|nr:hypothetical protein IGI04_023069 [Brassica rapa subsp. trilocularis]
MLNWTSSLSIWEKPNRVLLLSHHLRSSWLLHRRLSTRFMVIDISVIIWTILSICTRRSMGLWRMMDMRLFSQVECYSPVLESLVRHYSIDGFLLHMMHVCIFSRGSRFEHTQFLHQKAPWPEDIKGLMHSPFSVLKSVWDGSRCNRWIASNDLLREKWRLLTRTESHKKDLTSSRTKWRKASESVSSMNVFGSIVSLLYLFNVHFSNMFIEIYVSCNLLH